MNKTLLSSKIKEHLSTAVFYLSILFFIIGFNFTDSVVNGWYQQFMPNIGGRQITEITFLDSLIGFAVTNNLSVADTGYILKTTNSGNNWSFSFIVNRGFAAIEFINSNTGYACGGSGGGTTYLCRTTNSGLNWLPVNTPSAAKWQDMDVINNDTIYLADNDGLTGGVFRTTDSGASWQQQLYIAGNNPSKIYMYNSRIGFCCNNLLYKTTNSGLNWTQIPGQDGFTDMHFIDSLTGWKAKSYIKKTTDGGFNWIQQALPSGGIITSPYAGALSVINKDTIWAAGGQVNYGGSQSRAILFRTINGGNNWLFQVPDTTIHISTYYTHLQFINSKVGWAYTLSGIIGGVHTTTGGDIQWLTDVKQISNNIPSDYILYQNYPNPFNPSTTIRFDIKSLSNVKIIVYDLTGRQIEILADKEYKAGSYEIIFNAGNYSSGVYFYSLEINGHLISTKKLILLK